MKILDKDIIKKNMQNFKETIMKEEKGIFLFENSIKEKRINKTNYFDNIDYQEEYEIIKMKNKHLFEEKRKKRVEDIAYLLSYDNLGQKCTNGLTYLLQIKNKNEYWKPSSQSETNMILQGFKNLYNDKGEKKITKEYLCNIMKNTINLIRSTSDIENIQIKIKGPKSKALDYYGFNQQKFSKL